MSKSVDYIQSNKEKNKSITTKDLNVTKSETFSNVRFVINPYLNFWLLTIFSIVIWLLIVNFIKYFLPNTSISTSQVLNIISTILIISISKLKWLQKNSMYESMMRHISTLSISWPSYIQISCPINQKDLEFFRGLMIEQIPNKRAQSVFYSTAFLSYLYNSHDHYRKTIINSKLGEEILRISDTMLHNRKSLKRNYDFIINITSIMIIFLDIIGAILFSQNIHHSSQSAIICLCICNIISIVIVMSMSSIIKNKMLKNKLMRNFSNWVMSHGKYNKQSYFFTLQTSQV